MSKSQITVQDTPITVMSEMGNDYICLTDMAGAKSDEVRAADVIKNWLRNRYTIEFLGTWEQIHNPNFNVVEFDHFRMHAGLPNFVLSVSEWLEKTNAVFINEGMPQQERLHKLNQIAIQQMTVLENVESKHILKA